VLSSSLIEGALLAAPANDAVRALLAAPADDAVGALLAAPANDAVGALLADPHSYLAEVEPPRPPARRHRSTERDPAIGLILSLNILASRNPFRAFRPVVASKFNCTAAKAVVAGQSTRRR
jgi:hypothetical protein